MLERIFRLNIPPLHSDDDSELNLVVDVLVDPRPQIESCPRIKNG